MEGGPGVPERRDVGRLLPWVIEAAFVAGLMAAGLAVFLILTSGQDPFGTAWIPVIVALAVIAAVLRHLWVRRHESETGVVRERQMSRERRGF
jgi:hypothetical protein